QGVPPRRSVSALTAHVALWPVCRLRRGLRMRPPTTISEDPAGCTRDGPLRPAADQLHQVPDGDNPDEPAILDYGQASGAVPTHQVCRLPDRGVGRRGRDSRRHQVPDGTPLPQVTTTPAAEIAVRDHAQDVAVVDDDQMMNT